MMGEGAALLAFVTLQRLAELIWSARNARRLLARGGVEFGRGHYPVMVALHAAWLAALWLAGASHPVGRLWLAVFILLQAGRAWVLVTLRERWTTRVIVLPGAPLVTGGPYRFLRHPNYWIVAAEIVVVPLALALPWFALFFGIANAVLLAVRIRRENKALLEAGAAPQGA